MMRLAISNIAWRPEESAAIYPILAQAGVRGLEIAPPLAFNHADDPFRPSASDLASLRATVGTFDLALVSMQSLLFGVQGARLFGEVTERAAFELGIERAIALAERLRIPNLVMGSPANRVIPPSMEAAEAERIAVAAFQRLGDKAETAGTKLALEPNPTAYGANFLTTMTDAITFAALIDHPAITVNFDLGALHMNGEIERAAEIYDRGSSKVSHVHISEPHLVPAPQDEKTFGKVADALIARGYRGWFSIEMRQIGEDNRENVQARVETCGRLLAAAAA